MKAKVGDEAIEVEYLCIAGGRAPDTEALGLDAAGVKTGDGGKVEIDEYQRTSNQKVYAIGDLVRGPALAHKARRRASSPPRRSPAPPPTRSTQTSSPAPPSATRRSRASGSPRQQAKDAGNDVKVGKMKLGGVGASAVYDDRDGIVKLVVDSRVRRDPRRPRRRQPGLRHDRRARRRRWRSRAATRSSRGSSTPTRRSPRRSSTPPAPSTAGRSTSKRAPCAA